mmetsp:Transcript_26682/g.56166  ORF Transcript_26682/g.56166 Transcript_26682/m.56166 type:complete len:834 (-) Transcript_26682:102-2603(-)
MDEIESDMPHPSANTVPKSHERHNAVSRPVLDVSAPFVSSFPKRAENNGSLQPQSIETSLRPEHNGTAADSTSKNNFWGIELAMNPGGPISDNETTCPLQKVPLKKRKSHHPEDAASVKKIAIDQGDCFLNSESGCISSSPSQCLEAKSSGLVIGGKEDGSEIMGSRHSELSSTENGGVGDVSDTNKGSRGHESSTVEKYVCTIEATVPDSHEKRSPPKTDDSHIDTVRSEQPSLNHPSVQSLQIPEKTPGDKNDGIAHRFGQLLPSSSKQPPDDLKPTVKKIASCNDAVESEKTKGTHPLTMEEYNRHKNPFPKSADASAFSTISTVRNVDDNEKWPSSDDMGGSKKSQQMIPSNSKFRDEGAGSEEQMRSRTSNSTNPVQTSDTMIANSNNHSAVKHESEKKATANKTSNIVTNNSTSETTNKEEYTESGLMNFCLVDLPADSKPGDRLSIRWPLKKQILDCKFSQNEIDVDGNTKKGDASNSLKNTPWKIRLPNLTDPPTMENVDIPDGNLLGPLVTITVPQNIPSSPKPQRIRVMAPWIAAKRRLHSNLTTRQLRSVGVGTSRKSLPGDEANPRRSQRRTKTRGEGATVSRSSRVGEKFQVSMSSIPSADTWKKETFADQQRGNTASSRDVGSNNIPIAESEPMWDKNLAAEAYNRGEPLDKFIDSLKTYQRARGILSLHKSSYCAVIGKQTFYGETLGKLDPNHRNSLLEGMPLTQRERIAFHNAIDQYQKNFYLIAKDVGTTVSRCLVYYYSFYKSGPEKSKYQEMKKIFGQSDECKICNDGGELICCDGCINSYHLKCIKPEMKEVPKGQWFCTECEEKRRKGIEG